MAGLGNSLGGTPTWEGFVNSSEEQLPVSFPSLAYVIEIFYGAKWTADVSHSSSTEVKHH